MNAIAFADRLSATRKILTRSIATVLTPAIALFVGAALTVCRADDSASAAGGILTDTLGAATDISNLFTNTSGSTIGVFGTNFGPVNFPGITTQINVIFQSTNQSVEFDTGNFSFKPPVTITAGAGAATDQVVVAGSNAITFTGASTYGGGTVVIGGQVIFNNASALGTGAVTLSSDTELTGSGTLAFSNIVNFSSGTTNATLAATAGSTITFAAINSANTANLTFGSAGHTGQVIVGLLATSVSGNVTVADGTLSSGPGGGLGNLLQNATSITVDAGAKLNLKDNSTTVPLLQGAGTVNLGSKASTILTLSGVSTSIPFAGVISGAGQVAISGVTLFTGTNTYTGGTNLLALSVLDVGARTTSGSIEGNVSLGNNSRLVFERTDPYSFGGTISGTGEVHQDGPSVLTLSGINTYSGGTDLLGGDLVVTNNQAVGTGPVLLGLGTELRASGTVTLSSNTVGFLSGATGATVSATPGGTLTLTHVDFSNLTGSLTIGSAGNTGTVVIGPGTGTITTNTDDLTVAFGTLRNGGILGVETKLGGVVTTVNAGATLDVHDSSLILNDLEGAGAVTLGTKSATTLTVATGNFDGVISGAGHLEVAGFVTLTGANTYGGGTTVDNGGFLRVGINGATGSITGNVSLANNSTLQFQRSTAYSFAGIISGAGRVAQAGSGPLTLSGINTYSGGTSITSTGALIVTNSSALGTGSVSLGSVAELRGSGAVTLPNLVSFFNLTTNATLSAAAGGTFTVNQLDISNTAAITFGSSGNTGAVVIGPNAANTRTGNNVTVAFGTLRNGDGLSVLTAAGNITTVNAGATLDLNDIPTGISSLAGSGNVTLGSQKATLLTLDDGNFDGTISGAGALSINNLVIFTGANTYTGGTTVALDSDLQLGNGGTTGSVTGGIALRANAGLIFDRSNAYTFAGNITGNGFLEQNGSGVLTLSGINSYLLGTIVKSGVLVAAKSFALGTGPVTLSTGTEFRGSGVVTLNNLVQFNSGTTNAILSATPGGSFTLNNLDASNTAALTFGSAGNTGTVSLGSGVTVGPNSHSVTVAFGTLRNGGGLSQLLQDSSVQTTVNSGATLAVNDLDTEVATLQGSGSVKLGSKATTVLTLDSALFGGVISGAGSVVVSGFEVFTGANTYTGGTTVNGVMILGNGTTTGSIVGSISLGNGGAILEFARSNAYKFTGPISGTGSVAQVGAGVLTLAGANSYSGGTLIISGVLAVPNSGALGTGPVTLSGGAEFRSSGTVLFTDPITYIGTSSATISTTGILTLPNLNDSGSGLLIFGSSGHAGTVGIPSTGTLSAASNARIEVAFGTLSNGGGLSTLTSSAVLTHVNQGATLSLSDFNTTINNLTGAGTVKTGTKSSTVLTLAGAFFQGTISGAGQVNATGGGSGLVDLLTPNTYTGGTTVSAGGLAANNSSGSATGSGPITIDNGATIGGSGTVSGAMTLESGGTIKPGLNNNPGTQFHGSSLLWEGGGILDLQISSVTTELLLTGALTKGTAGAFTIDIEDDTIVTGSYTLATFASTTFSLSDFTLDLPNGISGTLVENSQSLVLDITQAAASSQNLSASTASDLTATASDLATPSIVTPDTSFTSNELLQPTPEPASALLLAFGGAALLGWRRQRNA